MSEIFSGETPTMQLRKFCYSTLMTGAFAASIITSGASAQLGGGDECASAVVIAADTLTNFDTTTATPSGDIPTDALCAGTYLNWVATCKDVWFKFTASGPGTADFTTCGTAAYDTSLALYKGNCSTLVACNGDGTGCAGFSSKIETVPCSAGDVFYIRIGGYGGDPTPDGDFGAGQITVVFAASSAGCVGATGACNVVHPTTGCDNPVCCTNICNFNPLCCEAQWDQSCVDLAIELCGYYSCPASAGAPVNNCATSPSVIPAVSSSRAFTTVGATTDGPDHDGAICNSGSAIFAGDVWYRVTPVANGSMKISTCEAVSFDNKLAVYNLGSNPSAFDYNTLSSALVGCNDDGATGTCNTTENPPTNYASEMSVSVSLGNTYLIRMGAYAEGDFGTGTITFTLPVACVLDTAGVNEEEPCGAETNDGCNGGGQSQPLALGSILAGTLWADADARDTDFYSFSVSAGSQVTLSVKSARNVNVLLLSGDLTVAECAGISVLASGTGSCPTVSTYCLNQGVYYAFVCDSAFVGNPCGSGSFNDYSMSITATPATCPILVSGGAAANGTCSSPGPNNMSLNTDPNLVAAGIVACAYTNPAFPGCTAGGGTTANSYARVFQAGTVSGNISCVNFGVFCTVRGTNAAGTACATYYSDIPLPATIGIYQDLDGGAPRFKTADNGADGGDLAKISEQAVLIPGGVYRATLNFAQPICVEQYETKNLVLIMDIPDMSVAAPGAHGLRPGSNTAGPLGGNTYCRLSCADGAGAYVLTESLGASFNSPWVVEINGNNAASCSAPACPGDLNGDNVRNGADLATLLSAWGTTGGDINGDGTTNGADLAGLLSGWGACPQ